MDKAVFELSEKLRHPSDIRARLAAIEADTKEDYESHASKFRDRLGDGYSALATLQNRIGKMDKLLGEFKESKTGGVEQLREFTRLIDDYKTIKTVSLAHQNFLRIRYFTEMLKTAEDNCADDDIDKYHQNIYDREEFACELEQYNTGLDKEDFARIEGILHTIKRMSLEFTTLVLEIVSEFIENKEAVARIGKIVDKEEKRDELTRRAKAGEKGRDIEMQQIAKMYPRYMQRLPKELKDKVVHSLKSAIKAKFTSINTGEPFIHKLDFVLDDLKCIQQDIHLKFFSFDNFLMEYHRNLKELIDSSVERLDAGEILALIEFNSSYYNTLEGEYNKVGESLGRPIVENESVLLEKYSRAASEKLKGWIDNITAMELERFASRDPKMGRDEDEKLISSGFIQLLQIIQTQLVSISFSKRVFLHITEAVKTRCMEFRDAIMGAVEREFRLACNNKAKPGFEDYCIMFGNSGLKLTQSITSLPQCQTPEVRDLGNTFIGILKGCNHFLAEFMISTCQPALEKVFTEEWETSDTTQVLVATILDFLEDYFSMMSTFSFSAFIADVCAAVTNAYFRRCKSKKIKITAKSSERLEEDYSRLLDLFSRYVPKEDAEEALGPLKKLSIILETSDEEKLSNHMKILQMSSGEIGYDAIKNLFIRRDNINEDVRARAIDEARRIFKSMKGRNKKMPLP